MMILVGYLTSRVDIEEFEEFKTTHSDFENI
jgi:hypothetical protein